MTIVMNMFSLFAAPDLLNERCVINLEMDGTGSFTGIDDLWGEAHLTENSGKPQ